MTLWHGAVSLAKFLSLTKLKIKNLLEAKTHPDVTT